MDWDCRFFADLLQMEFWIADFLQIGVSGPPPRPDHRNLQKTCDTQCGLQVFCRLGFRGGPTTALCKTSAHKSAIKISIRKTSAKSLQTICNQNSIRKKIRKTYVFSGHISFPRSRLSKAYSLHPTSEDREVLFLTRGVGVLDC